MLVRNKEERQNLQTERNYDNVCQMWVGNCFGKLPLCGGRKSATLILECIAANWRTERVLAEALTEGLLSVSQEISRLLWNQKVHYRVHKSLTQGPILSHINPIHILLLNFPTLHSRITLPYTVSPKSGFFPSRVPGI
jgi:hypothetical protein